MYKTLGLLTALLILSFLYTNHIFVLSDTIFPLKCYIANLNLQIPYKCSDIYIYIYIQVEFKSFRFLLTYIDELRWQAWKIIYTLKQFDFF